MNQSNYIIGSVLFAFFVYITLKGSLPTYISVFDGTAGSANSGASTGANASSATPSTAGQAVQSAAGTVQNYISTLTGLPTNVFSWLGGAAPVTQTPAPAASTATTSDAGSGSTDASSSDSSASP